MDSTPAWGGWRRRCLPEVLRHGGQDGPWLLRSAFRNKLGSASSEIAGCWGKFLLAGSKPARSEREAKKITAGGGGGRGGAGGLKPVVHGGLSTGLWNMQ